MKAWFYVFLIVYFAMLVGLFVAWRTLRANRAWVRENAETIRAQQRARVGAKQKGRPDFDSLEARLERLQEGCVVWKYAFGHAAWRSLRGVSVSTSIKKAIICTNIKGLLGKRSDRTIELADVLAVQLGPVSATFERCMAAGIAVAPDRCFSIITPQRTLDLEVADGSDLRDWFLYLQDVFFEEQVAAGLPLYDAAALTRAAAAISAGAPPPKAFAYDCTKWCRTIGVPPPPPSFTHLPTPAPQPRTLQYTEPIPGDGHFVDVDCSIVPRHADCDVDCGGAAPSPYLG